MKHLDYKLLFDVAVLAGELMASNGAETYRVEDTVLRILRLSKLKTADVFVTMTGFTVTLDDPNRNSMTIVRRIAKRGINLGKIHEVNMISRQLCQDEITLEEALKSLKQVKKATVNTKWNYLAMISITSFFTLMFGGKLPEFLISIITGILIGFLINFSKKYDVHLFLQNLICAFCVALIAFAGKFIPNIVYDLDPVIIGSIMPLVPGVAITNAVYDTLHGDYLSGVARALEAIVIAVSLAVGIGFGLSFCQYMIGVIV